MNSIYLCNGEETKLNNIYSINNSYQHISLQFKKIYHKKIKLLKEFISIPYDIIGIINEYLMDIFNINIVYKRHAFDLSISYYKCHVHFNIKSNDINIDFQNYDFNYTFCVHYGINTYSSNVSSSMVHNNVGSNELSSGVHKAHNNVGSN